LIQVIDVRDLAEWTIRLMEERATGTYNITGPETALTMEDLLRTAKEESGSDARFVWADESWLLEQGVEPWSEMPLWIPEDDAVFGGMMQVDVGKAIASGATFRPIAATVRDTLQWDRTRPMDAQRGAGLPQERETALLEARRASDATHTAASDAA
jgi:2'-hydroxyisoflavone reductase